MELFTSKLTSRFFANKFSILLIFSMVFLPSGSIGSLNVKIILMMGLFFFVLLTVFNTKKINKDILKIFILLILSIIFVLINYYTASHESITSGYAGVEIRSFVTYFISTSIILVAIYENFLSREKTVKVIIYSSFFYSLIKIFLIFLSVIGIVSINAIAEMIYNVYGIKPMLLPITDKISRFQLANDYIVCFVLFFMICDDKLEKVFPSSKVRKTITVALVLSMLISFSRYMVILFIIAYAIKVLRVRVFTLKRLIVVIVLLCIGTGIIINYQVEISDTISKRFSSDANESSDGTRVLQINCLTKDYEERLFYGKGGFGDYSIQCPGPTEAPFSYEVMYAGYLYKFGLIQTILFSFLYFSQYSLLVKGSILSKVNRISTVAAIWWMLVGFFNPYLVSGYGSIIMVLCLCMAEYNKNRGK
ncbi:hypothetical protein V2I52_00500 [Brenneria sp. g21c3]|uniref:hypothetical protein n=1 Tax=Brenneria sp. g21c3 TaxID=3093893 RepID=UPI002EA478B9|nr:hypothetical protein [Brenneria sp. g21c3]